MRYDSEKPELPVVCPSCGWSGTLDQTHDMDAMTSEFETVGQVAVCPKCGAEVRRSDGEPTAEEAKGFAWWNSLADEGRAYWLGRAGGPGRSVFHAWTVYRAAETGSPGGDGVS